MPSKNQKLQYLQQKWEKHRKTHFLVNQYQKVQIKMARHIWSFIANTAETTFVLQLKQTAGISSARDVLKIIFFILINVPFARDLKEKDQPTAIFSLTI